ncbi:MAG: FtsX-like permease family protein [Muribaculaceae bacterium]|nr:FtsX-like permease family protein [Muribaculaceae bacterium]
MKRALIKQMTSEWRINVWLVLEMAVVALAIWAMLSVTWMESKGILESRGFSPEDVYSIEVRNLNINSPDYRKEYESNYIQDREELMKRLKDNPNVDYVSLHNNVLPYNFNFMGNIMNIEGAPDSVEYYANCRKAEPDIIKILDIKSTTGKTQEELVAMLERGEVLLSPNKMYEEKFGDVKELIGKKISFYDLETPARVGDIVENVRRTDYEPRNEGMVLYSYDPNKPDWGNIALKVKPGRGKAFEEDFKTDRSMTRLRNVFLTDLQRLTDLGEVVNTPQKIDNRLRVGISAFLLITIFLGLLGSFWFRVQQRISEIAIRKTFGATDKDLFRRIIGEGLLLLLAGLLFTSACVWPFIGEIVEITGEEWYAFLAVEAVTAGLMAVGIILSLWYPAYRAMKIEPAIAVKEE